jgi:hypothetical protein
MALSAGGFAAAQQDRQGSIGEKGSAVSAGAGWLSDISSVRAKVHEMYESVCCVKET